MLKETKQLITNSSIYSVGNILIKLVAFLLIPLYARKLTPNEYGVVAILELIELIGKTIFVFGLGNSVLRFFTHYKKRNIENELIFSILATLFFSNILILGVLYLFPEGIVNASLALTNENILYFRYIIIVIFIGVMQRIFIVNLQAEEKAFHYIIFMLINFILLISLNIYKVGYQNEGILGIVESKLYVAILNIILFLFYFFLRYRPKFSFLLIKENIQYGFPLMFVGLSMTFLTLVDRYILKVLTDLSKVGIYTMSYKFGMVINMILVTPFRQAFFPLMFRMADEQDLGKLYRKYMTYFLFAGLWFFLAISVFAKEFMIIFTSPDYVAGYIIIPIISFSYLLEGIRNITSNVLAAAKRTKIIASTAIIGVIINVGLNFILISHWGILGAAFATVIAYAAIVIIAHFYQQKIFRVNWDWNRIWKLLGISMLLFCFSFLPLSRNIYSNLAWKLLMIIAYPIILYLINFFNKAEIDSIKKIINHIK